MHPAVDQLIASRSIDLDLLSTLLHSDSPQLRDALFAASRSETERVYGNEVFMRGLIEFSSYCRNDCLYCGLRRSHRELPRYRMTLEEILACCRLGYQFGMRTFVLQSGEDAWWTDERLCQVVASIRSEFADCAITLSVGERSRESYQRLFDSGANRYLLRHETADAAHYAQLHPSDMSFAHRIQCLHTLKEIGYQVGCGFMVGSPGQTDATLLQDLQFITSFRPHMVGIGPFVATQHTPFANEPNGEVELTLRLLAIIRLLHPTVLLPATTALGSLHPLGREQGIRAGANVVMPNLSPVENRKQYNIYDNKICLGDDVAHCRSCLERRIESVGRHLVVARGDYRHDTATPTATGNTPSDPTPNS
ncbi:MAG: [Bacteroidales bacterium]|nr:[FeFe] hydrogenase H-cluster radical SAM maturase HydE [Bacteroidales bacterium]